MSNCICYRNLAIRQDASNPALFHVIGRELPKGIRSSIRLAQTHPITMEDLQYGGTRLRTSVPCFAPLSCPLPFHSA